MEKKVYWKLLYLKRALAIPQKEEKRTQGQFAT